MSVESWFPRAIASRIRVADTVASKCAQSPAHCYAGDKSVRLGLKVLPRRPQLSRADEVIEPILRNAQIDVAN